MITDLSQIDAIEEAHMVKIVERDGDVTEMNAEGYDDIEFDEKGQAWHMGEPVDSWWELFGHLKKEGGVDDFIRFPEGTPSQLVFEIAAIIEREVGEPALHIFQDYHPKDGNKAKRESRSRIEATK
jgi:hypothetical protein